MKTTNRTARALLLIALMLTTLVSAAEPAQTLPRLRLADPRGAVHRLDELGPVILVVSAPTADAEADQRDWDEALAATRPASADARVVFVEDLSQSWFPELAREAMRDAFDPARGPLVLIDEDGGARRALHVDEDATVVLVYDGRGRLVATHTDGPGRQAAADAWKRARGR